MGRAELKAKKKLIKAYEKVLPESWPLSDTLEVSGGLIGGVQLEQFFKIADMSHKLEWQLDGSARVKKDDFLKLIEKNMELKDESN